LDVLVINLSTPFIIQVVLGWTASALVWAAGLYLWWRAVRRIASGRPKTEPPPPAVQDPDHVAQPPPAVRDEESAQARAPVPHLVPTRAHAGSALFASGAGLLLAAVGFMVRAFGGSLDYAEALLLIAEVLFAVSLYHGLIVARRRRPDGRPGSLWPIQAGLWPLLVLALLFARLILFFWLWVLLWFLLLSLWLLGPPAALAARKLGWRTRRAVLTACAGTFILLYFPGRAVVSAAWLARGTRWSGPSEPFPTALAGEGGLRDGFRLLRFLGSDRQTAVKALGEFGDPRALPLLSDVLRNDVSENVRSAAAGALGKLRDQRAVEPLIHALRNDTSEWTRGATARALSELGDQRAVEPLITALRNDAAVVVRWSAAWALGKLRDQRAVEPLIHALRNDAAADVRGRAAQALGEPRDQWAVEPLLDALRNDAAAGGRMFAAEALGRLGDQRAVEPLLHALRNDADVRGTAARALGELGDQRAVEPLIDALRTSTSEWAREPIADALKAITGRDFGTDAEAWQKWRQEEKEGSE